MTPEESALQALLGRYSVGPKHLVEPGPSDEQLVLGDGSGGYGIYFERTIQNPVAITQRFFTAYPDVFRGGYFLMGGLMFYEFHARGEEILATVLRAPWEAPIDQIKKEMRLVFLIGLIALPFAPETRGKPLPE